jgi:hypothetical protein
MLYMHRPCAWRGCSGRRCWCSTGVRERASVKRKGARKPKCILDSIMIKIMNALRWKIRKCKVGRSFCVCTYIRRSIGIGIERSIDRRRDEMGCNDDMKLKAWFQRDMYGEVDIHVPHVNEPTSKKEVYRRNTLIRMERMERRIMHMITHRERIDQGRGRSVGDST